MQSSANIFTITERPVIRWFIGAVFSGFGLVLVLQHDAPTLMGVFFLFIGLFLVLNSPLITVALDRDQKLLILHRQALIRRDNMEIPLNEIVNIVLQPKPRNSRSLLLSVLLQDGSEIPLVGLSSGDEDGKKRQVEQMQQFLGLKGSPKPAELPKNDINTIQENPENLETGTNL